VRDRKNGVRPRYLASYKSQSMHNVWSGLDMYVSAMPVW